VQVGAGALFSFFLVVFVSKIFKGVLGLYKVKHKFIFKLEPTKSLLFFEVGGAVWCLSLVTVGVRLR